MYNCKAVYDIKTDFDETLTKCVEVTDRYVDGKKSLNIFRQILRLFAVLM